jgi:hypothetical protein
MSDRKTTPKAGITLLSREDDKLKFFHSPSGAADFALKHKFNKQLSLGLGFTVRSLVACGRSARACLRRDCFDRKREAEGGGPNHECLSVPLCRSRAPPLSAHTMGQRTGGRHSRDRRALAAAQFKGCLIGSSTP